MTKNGKGNRELKYQALSSIRKEYVNLKTDLLILLNQMRKKIRMKKSEESLGELWDTIKKNNICIMEVPEGKGRGRKGWKTYLKKYG